MSGTPLIASRTSGVLRSDPRRVVVRLFVPGQELLIQGESRVAPVIERILALSPDVAAATLATTMERFGDRHDDLVGLLDENFAMVAHRVGAADDLPVTTRRLMGAYFSHEYAIEAAALFNPSIVLGPDQSDVAPGEVRVVLSLRAVGEGHLSSIEFRSGIVGTDGTLRLDTPNGDPVVGRYRGASYNRGTFHRALLDLGQDSEDAAFVLDTLPDPFDDRDLDQAVSLLHEQPLTFRTADLTVEHLRRIASCNYAVGFPESSDVGSRVLMPTAPIETNGMEDARFVRFTDDDGSVTYYATYTAYDGRQVVPQLLSTTDFLTFSSTQLTGPAAANKGMAIFPRRIGGRFVALSRWDRENNGIAMSDDGHDWDEPVTLQTPTQPWELVQIGNCGSPVETPEGWLVLTHGVGPMRSYAIGAVLLDRDDPTRMIGQLTEPILRATDAERDGYVPNVAYTCGALAHGDRLVMPYGCADSSIGVAVIDLLQLRKRLVDSPPVG